MIIAAVLALSGLLIGLAYGYAAIAVASAAVTALFFAVWIVRAEFGLFTVLIWIGYLFALQTGFLIGAYLGTPEAGAEGASPEPDRPPGLDA